MRRPDLHFKITLLVCGGGFQGERSSRETPSVGPLQYKERRWSLGWVRSTGDQQGDGPRECLGSGASMICQWVPLARVRDKEAGCKRHPGFRQMANGRWCWLLSWGDQRRNK